MITNVVTLKDTNERVRYYAKQSWRKVYYSFDHQASWHSSKQTALKAARVSGLLAVIDREVVMPSGEIAIAR